MSVPKPVFLSGAIVNANRICLWSGLNDGRAGAEVGGSSTTRPRIFAVSSRQRRPDGFARMKVAVLHAAAELGTGAAPEPHELRTSATRRSARFRR